MTDLQDSDPGEVRLSKARLDRILAAAQTIFMAHGFNGATTDMIQAAAGVSKSTLYRYFPTKEILFKAAFEAFSREFLTNVGRLCRESDGVETFLNQFGMEFLQALIAPRGLDIFRLMVSESQRFPKPGKLFYLVGPKATADMVESYLARAHRRGELHVASPAIAAEHFIGMIRGDLHLRCLLGVSKPPSTAQLKRFVAATVAAFLAAYRPAAGKDPEPPSAPS
ncbi:TetR/AcrR family transcriptional regulator [Phenylobacterium sp.]|uniref:TetR/AcrR family transcriptional regulator n=1 Tax=Phenylobacterium sp. TaxID=1871053 RepID=UPI002F41315F